jgi:hypothetical protein
MAERTYSQVRQLLAENGRLKHPWVYVEDEEDELNFCIRTLPDHIRNGEDVGLLVNTLLFEFLCEWDATVEEWYTEIIK